MGQKSKN